MPKGIYKHKLHSEETKKKMSNSHRGKKRAPYNEETKQKMSDFWRKWWAKKSKEERAKTTEKARQFNQSAVAKQKRSESGKKRWAKMTKEERLKTVEVKQKISQAVKKHWNKMTKEEKTQASQAFQKAGHEARLKKLARMTREERKQYLKSWIEGGRKARVGSTIPLRTRQKISKSVRELWANRTKEEKLRILRFRAKAGLEAQAGHSSSIEKDIWKVLDELSINYKTQVSFSNGKFIVDIYIPTQRLIIECNGDYWHKLPKIKERDKMLEEYARKNNLKTIWLWESEIKKSPKSALIAGLQESRIGLPSFLKIKKGGY